MKEQSENFQNNKTALSLIKCARHSINRKRRCNMSDDKATPKFLDSKNNKPAKNTYEQRIYQITDQNRSKCNKMHLSNSQA